MSIRWKIILSILVPMLVIYIAIIAFNIYRMQRQAVMNTERRMSELASNYASRFDLYLREAAQAANLTAAFVRNNPHVTSSQIYAQLHANLQYNPLIYGSAVCFEPYLYQKSQRLFVRYAFRGEDAIVLADPAASGYDYTEAQQEYWHKPRSTGEAVWTEPYDDEDGGNILMATYSIPFYRDEKFLGIATVDIPLEQLRELVDVGIPEYVDFFIITGAGKYVYSSHAEHINKSIFEISKQRKREDLLDVLLKIGSGKAGTEKVAGWYSDEPEWIFYAPIKFPKWGFAVSIPEKKALATVRAQFYWQIVLFGVSLILLFACMWFLAVKISRPIVRLNDAAREISKGDLNVTASIKSNDEIGTLSNTFDDMCKKISEREQSLRESEEKYRAITDSAKDSIFCKDSERKYTFVNPAMEQLLGPASEVIGRTPEEIFDKASAATILKVDRKVLNGEITNEIHSIMVGDEQKTFHTIQVPLFDTDRKVMGMAGIVRDITENMRMEEEKNNLQKQLQQSQKMESIGTLAGGVAHDFNNMLSVILGNAELAMDDVPEWHPVRNNLEQVKTASLRAKDVIRQLLSFSRKSDPKRKPVKISSIIEDSLAFIRSSIPTSIEIKMHISDESAIILADPTQMHQVMLNLCTNASHAMSESGGILQVMLYIVDMGKDETYRPIELKQGRYVKIIVSDTGRGIEKEDMDRIFDPYFTTKAVGKGSGIGLSVVHGIVKSNEGSISVDSEYGKGTTFTLLFPVFEEEPAIEEETNVPIPTGNEKILFVDDEASIVDMTGQMLKRLGYAVTAKTSSLDALATFKTQPGKFDLIISDMTMPDMTGDQLAQELLKIRPDIPIILCTGFSERINDEKSKLIGIQALVVKPVDKTDLAGTIRKVLDGKSKKNSRSGKRGVPPSGNAKPVGIWQ